MGVPKFFRYISERYPCLSEVVREYQIPEFDNLYLDMNGIIHQCSHPDDENVHFRITEEKIFKDIFHYIEVLFRMIKPQKLFFMAVDGVAPRAKMNQQRGRRFRSAKDSEKRREQAKLKGESLPEQEPFDSNCITPGTVFMAKLHEQLKYFVVDKISNDPMWQKCQIILSGHETPGEGEHKIMDYIRYMRSQPNYDPHTRHCLYGLDADLIMLGLCTHEPHFSLLREEVKFGRKSTKRISVPEEIRFYLLHLSLMRDYLDLEFASLKDSLVNFKFDLEQIIDDWVLMGFLVGNDFIPHLPNMHIFNGALPVLYKAYMEILPSLNGYINENGKLNLERFEKFMEKLSSIDLDNFNETRDDLLYMQRKTGRKFEAHTKVSSKPDDECSNNFDSGLDALKQQFDEMFPESDKDDDDDENDDVAFINYKKEYYRNKLEYENVTSEVMKDQAEGYVRAIQWNLNYYYNGCCSWSWYYPHHYAPYISDIKGFSNLEIKFEYGKPFLPFEQLLAVLPPASKNLLPECYHGLMLDENSLISQYYPENFETDLNGKKQEWEAVVLVPFIDETLLLKAMNTCNDKLTDEERRRNSHGPMLIYTYTTKDNGRCVAPEYFGEILHNHTNVVTMLYSDVLIPESKLVKGYHPRATRHVFYPGFPTLRYLKYTGELRNEKIKVFESPSRNENMIITLIPKPEFSNDLIPVDLLGTNIYVNWPHLMEAKVVAISNSKRKYICMGGPNEFNIDELNDNMVSQFQSEIESVSEYYERRMGIRVGKIKVLVYVQQLIGYKYVVNQKGKFVLEKQFATVTSNYPLQAIVYDIKTHIGTRTMEMIINELFPPKGICFVLTNPYYGSQGTVGESLFEKGRIKITVPVMEEPDLTSVIALHEKIKNGFKNLHICSTQLSIAHSLFSRITGSVYITTNIDGVINNINIGLNLKFNKKNAETPGYTKKLGNTWYYTDKAVELVKQYCENFPEVFDYMSRDNSFGEINAEVMFGEQWAEKVNAIKSWLSSLPTYNLERQSCGTLSLDSEIMKEIEKVVSNFTSKVSKKVTMQVKPNLLYVPDIQSGTLPPDPKADCRMFDRIVNVRSGFTVPFGCKGTVVSILTSSGGSERDTMYDIVFDTPFPNGMKLSCSEERCYRLPKTAFINISYGKRLLEDKAGKSSQLIMHQTRSGENNYQNDMNSPQLYPFPQQQYFGQMNSAFAQFNQNQSNYFKNGSRQQNFNQERESGFNGTQKKPRENHPRYFDKQPLQEKINYPLRKEPTNNFLPQFAFKPETDYNNPVNIQIMKTDNVSAEGRSTMDNQTKPKGIHNVKKGERAHEKSNIKVDTEFLKKVLKIDSDKNEEMNTETKNLVRSRKFDDIKSQSSITKKEDMVNFDLFTSVADKPATIRLMTYFQSNGLGLPRYKYFPEGNLIKAQIKLPQGDTILGKPANDNETATENVAASALDQLMKKVKKLNENKETIPEPPKSWINPENKTIQNKNEEKPKLVDKSFVPLQVVKNQISKSATKIVDKHEEKMEVKNTNVGEKEQNGVKKRKSRQSRIAANFQKRD